MDAGQQLSEELRAGGLIYCKGSPLEAVVERARIFSHLEIPIIISGESGTGKEELAKYIHQNSPRSGNIFAPLNCGAIPEGLVDSTLFGHTKGAYTGAYSDEQGILESANSGTLFLDEIGDLPLGVQVKLLRVMQDGIYRKVGSTQQQKANVRIVCASNKPLMKLVREGKFREDLYYRLRGAVFELPPLHARSKDVLLIADNILKDCANKHNLTALPLTEKAKYVLSGYKWPGNIREMQKFLEEALIVACAARVSAGATHIETEHLPNELQVQRVENAEFEEAGKESAARVTDKEVLEKLKSELLDFVETRSVDCDRLDLLRERMIVYFFKESYALATRIVDCLVLRDQTKTRDEHFKSRPKILSGLTGRVGLTPFAIESMATYLRYGLHQNDGTLTAFYELVSLYKPAYAEANKGKYSKLPSRPPTPTRSPRLKVVAGPKGSS